MPVEWLTFGTFRIQFSASHLEAFREVSHYFTQMPGSSKKKGRDYVLPHPLPQLFTGMSPDHRGQHCHHVESRSYHALRQCPNDVIPFHYFNSHRNAQR
jgi:hypothetical protein